MAKSEFFGSIWPSVLQASQSTGVDPRIIAAQAALESNYGKSAPGNNLFGIKSHGQSGGNSLMTTEVVNGVPVKVRDSFRGYSSPAESVSGYADFINTNKRYRPFREAQGLDAQIAALGQSGYATDPQYTSKIKSIASGIPLSSEIAARPAAPPQEPGSPAPQLASTTVSDRPVMGSIAPQQDVPPSVMAAAAPQTSTKSPWDMLGAMAMAQPEQPQFQPVDIRGPSPEQAQALTSFIEALKKRIA